MPRWKEGPEAKVHAPRVFQRPAERKFVFDRDGGICQICLVPVDPDLPYRDPETGLVNRMSMSIDHIIAVKRGGEHSLENAQLAHFGCNHSKNVRAHVPA
jgi:5-methylcytosine-specific restriction endonuclease McrA